jgi:endoglucanase
MIAISMAVGISSFAVGQVLKHPFPNHTRYVSGSVRPSLLSQAELDLSAKKFYALWKKNYLKNDCSDPRQYYVLNDEGNVKSSRSVICVSEGQGYGMQIVVLMAGFDKQAQSIYNGMFKFVAAHPTTKSPDLMSWSILKNCVTNIEHTGDEDENTSATDGDMDIALSLLMADAQWGSKGSVDYRREGMKRVRAILGFEINKRNHTVLLSDANNFGDDDYYDIRTSDFMPAHLKVFSKYLPDPEWKRVIDTMYAVFSSIQAKYSPQAGLLPDFIAYKAHKYVPAKPHYLESKFDGDYYYNACRVPFRVAVDYLLFQDSRAQKLLIPLNNWIQDKTQINADNICAGYYLNGQEIPNHKYATPAFVCPFTIAAMVDKNKQKWVNDCWNTVNDFEIKDYQYFDNSIQMLSLIIISGNYWLP